MSKKKVLVILAPGFEEIEAICPIDLLRRADADVLVASTDENLLIRGRCDILIQADSLLETALEEEYDLVVLPGGPGHARLRSNNRVLQFLEKHYKSGKPVGAICAAPLVLLQAGILKGHAYTAHSSVVDDLPEAVLDQAVVEDRLIITSRGAGTALEFSLALVGRLFGQEKAEEISKSICFRPDIVLSK